MKHLLSLILIMSFFCAHAFCNAANKAKSVQKIAFDKELSNYAYPFEVKTFKFSSQGKALFMAYMMLKGEETKPSIFLFHGKNFNGAYWKDTAIFLNKLGYTVVIPDQVGFGKSSKPENYQYSFSALAHNTQQLADHLGISKLICIGHSMGGMLASRFALSYSKNTERLILVNPIGLENYLRYAEYKDVNFFYQYELNKTPEKIISYQKENYYDGEWSQQYEALAVPLIGWVNGPDWQHLARVNALTYDMIFTQPVIEEFKYFTMPVDLILGVRDRTGPGRNWKKEGVKYELGRYDLLGDRVKQRNDAIRVHNLTGVGHLPHIEEFETFKTTVKELLKK